VCISQLNFSARLASNNELVGDTATTLGCELVNGCICLFNPTVELQEAVSAVLERPDPPDFHSWGDHPDWPIATGGPHLHGWWSFAICSV